MRGLFLFVVGIMVGLVVQSAAVGQSQNYDIVGLNHVGISVPDMDEALAYYTETLGFPEAFRATNANGEPTLVYVQISRGTFVELQPANDQRPPGISHFGVHVEDMDAATAMFRQRGANVGEIRVGSTQAILANITDLNGLRIELAELPPGTPPRQAMERWNSQP